LISGQQYGSSSSFSSNFVPFFDFWANKCNKLPHTGQIMLIYCDLCQLFHFKKVL
jgi:hypothetical protein